MAIVFAILTGMALSGNAITIQFSLNAGCEMSQANNDGNLLLFVIFLPGFIAMYGEDKPLGPWHLLWGTLSIICITIGVMFLSLAIKYGHAGPVQAIQNQNTTFQTILTAIML